MIITVNQNVIKPSPAVRDLDVLLDTELPVRQYFSRISLTGCAFFTYAVCTQFVVNLAFGFWRGDVATVLPLSRLDYCTP